MEAGAATEADMWQSVLSLFVEAGLVGVVLIALIALWKVIVVPERERADENTKLMATQNQAVLGMMSEINHSQERREKAEQAHQERMGAMMNQTAKSLGAIVDNMDSITEHVADMRSTQSTGDMQ